MTFSRYFMHFCVCVCVSDSCRPFLSRVLSVTFCGGRWFVFCGGNIRIRNSCNCVINPYVKKWGGLRYGNSHVFGVNCGNICALHHTFTGGNLGAQI